MNIEKAKEVIKNMDIDYMGSSICKECCFENDHKCFDDTNGDCQMIAINTLLNELDKKDKIINEMIQEYEYSARINVKDFCDEEIRKDKCIQDCTDCIKEYFTNKAMLEKPTEGV